MIKLLSTTSMVLILSLPVSAEAADFQLTANSLPLDLSPTLIEQEPITIIAEHHHLAYELFTIPKLRPTRFSQNQWPTIEPNPLAENQFHPLTSMLNVACGQSGLPPAFGPFDMMAPRSLITNPGDLLTLHSQSQSLNAIAFDAKTTITKPLRLLTHSIPEPATVLILGLSLPWLIRKRQRHST